MMSQFVHHDLPHLATDLPGAATASLDRSLIDRDSVWEHQTVPRGAFGQGYSLVQAEKSLAVREAHPPDLLAAGPGLDHHVYVFHLLLKLERQTIQSLCDQPLKPSSVHTSPPDHLARLARSAEVGQPVSRPYLGDRRSTPGAWGAAVPMHLEKIPNLDVYVVAHPLLQHNDGLG